MRVLVSRTRRKRRRFIRKALQAESFAVDVCHDGAEALLLAAGALRRGGVDIMLPGRDGLSVLRSCARQETTFPSSSCPRAAR